MRKILIVDDEMDALLMLEKRLVAEGYSVITATNGTDAIALAKSQRPDLIILDIVMPDIGGGEVAGWLKAVPETKNIPVIFLTALLSKTEEHRENHVITGNTFAKPPDTEELLAYIKRLLCNVTTS